MSALVSAAVGSCTAHTAPRVEVRWSWSITDPLISGAVAPAATSKALTCALSASAAIHLSMYTTRTGWSSEMSRSISGSGLAAGWSAWWAAACEAVGTHTSGVNREACPARARAVAEFPPPLKR